MAASEAVNEERKGEAMANEKTKLDAKLLVPDADLKARVEAFLEISGRPMHARDIAASTRATVRDVVNVLCDSALFRRVSRGVYGLCEESTS